MKTTISMAIGVAMLAGAASAEPVTRTTTFDGPKVSGSRVVTHDRAAGTHIREVDAVRKSDGAVASRDVTRTRTETGVVASGSAAGFAGRTRGFDYQRTRTDSGYIAQGTATGPRGGVRTRDVTVARSPGRAGRRR